MKHLIAAATTVALLLPAPVLAQERTQEELRNDILTTLLERLLAIKGGGQPTAAALPTLRTATQEPSRIAPFPVYPQQMAQTMPYPMPFPTGGGGGAPSVLVIPITTGTGGSDSSMNAMLMMMKEMQANKPAPAPKSNPIVDVLTGISTGFARGAAENLAGQLF